VRCHHHQSFGCAALACPETGAAEAGSELAPMPNPTRTASARIARRQLLPRMECLSSAFVAFCDQIAAAQMTFTHPNRDLRP
jgi:hypothetical protein